LSHNKDFNKVSFASLAKRIALKRLAKDKETTVGGFYVSEKSYSVLAL